MKKRYLLVVLILLVFFISGCEEIPLFSKKVDIKEIFGVGDEKEKSYFKASELDIKNEVFKVDQIFSKKDLEKERLEKEFLNGKQVSEHDFVKVTRWADPIKERPKYYGESKQHSPLFKNNLIYSSKSESNLIYLIIDGELYFQGLQDEISVYINDLENEGYSVQGYVGTYGNPEDIKSFLQTAYPSLIGVVFIGDIPTAWYEDTYNFGWGWKDEFPMDLYYMDLDGTWIDSDENGLYDAHSGNTDVEIWVGRIDATSLEGSTLSYYENYFYKNHQYRLGNLKLPTRALVYVDDDWSYEGIYESHWENAHKNLYEYATYVGHKGGTNGLDYTTRLLWDYEWITIYAHSSSTGHSLSSDFEVEGDWNSWISSNEIEGIDPHGLFYNLFACSSGRFTDEDYIAGRYLFADTYGLAVIGSTKTGSMLRFDEFYPSLGEGGSLGEAVVDWFNFIAIDGFNDREISWHYGMELFGDPTLKPNIPNDLPVSHINLRDYDEFNMLVDIPGTAKKGFDSQSTFNRFDFSYGYGINPHEWIVNSGTTEQNGGVIEIDNASLGEFDTSFTQEGYGTFKLNVQDNAGQSTDYKLVMGVNNIYLSNIIDKEFKKGDTNLNILGTVQGTNFESYEIKYGVGKNPDEWHSNTIFLTNNGVNEIFDTQLGVWSPTPELHDYYSLKLIRNDDNGFTTEDIISLVFDPGYLEGWPQKVNYRLVAPSVGVGDVDSDGYGEIVAGESRYDNYDEKNVYVWNHDGTNLNNWPKESVTNEFIRSLPVLIDVNQENPLEIFIGTGWGMLWGWDYQGDIVYDWPSYLNNEVINGPAIGDIDNNGDLELIFITLTGCGGSSCSPALIHAYHHDASIVEGWPIILERSISSPAIADFNGDGNLEIVVGAFNDEGNGLLYMLDHNGNGMSGWPIQLGRYIWNSPAIADLNKDGNLDILVCSDQLYAFNYDGSPINTFNPEISFKCSSGSLSFGDIDNDNSPEVVFAGSIEVLDEGDDAPWFYEGVIALNHDGTLVNGWPVRVDQSSDSTPVLGDIDGDPDIEILIATDSYSDKFYAFNPDGSVVSGWPKITPLREYMGWRSNKRSTPILTDLDADGDVDIILGDEEYLFVWDLDSQYYPERMEWPMFQHDSQHTGNYNYKSCGDGITQSPNIFGLDEECDDGNRINTDACTNQCSPAIAHDGICWEHRERCGECCDLQGGNCFPCDDCVGYSGSIANCDADEICTGFNPTNLNNQPRCTKSCSSNFPAGCFYIECPQEYDEITGYEADITDPLATACSTLDPNQQPHEETWVCCALPT